MKIRLTYKIEYEIGNVSGSFRFKQNNILMTSIHVDNTGIFRSPGK